MSVGHEKLGRESDNDISARCPVCGDSKKRKNSKRLHLYTKDSFDQDLVSCFNGDCPVKNKTVYSFLKDFYPSLIEQYKRETFSTTLKELSEGTDVFANYRTTPEKDKTDILTQDLSQFFKPIVDVPEAIKYLGSRGLGYDGRFGNWFYGYQNLKIAEKFYNIENSIIVPLYFNNKMYGFYSRNIENKNFSTYMNDVNIGYKIFNWFSIDKSKPVYIFEGIFDALSINDNNIIGSLGAKIPNERVKELKRPIFVLDNDKTGILNSINYAKEGFEVYVQPDQYKEKDMNQLKLNHPNLDLKKLIQKNLFTGISAEIRLKGKL